MQFESTMGRELRGLLELTGYYRKFVHKFLYTANLLYNLMENVDIIKNAAKVQ